MSWSEMGPKTKNIGRNNRQKVLLDPIHIQNSFAKFTKFKQHPDTFDFFFFCCCCWEASETVGDLRGNSICCCFFFFCLVASLSTRGGSRRLFKHEESDWTSSSKSISTTVLTEDQKTEASVKMNTKKKQLHGTMILIRFIRSCTHI